MKCCIRITITSPPDAIFQLGNAQNAFAAGDLPRISLGELTALPRTPNYINGDSFRSLEQSQTVKPLFGYWPATYTTTRSARTAQTSVETSAVTWQTKLT